MMVTLKLTLSAFIMAMFACVLFCLPVMAQNVTQGYEADGPVQNGMIVQLVSKKGAKVSALSQENELDMLGVVVPSSDAPVSLSDPTKQQVFVASLGQYPVLVSTQNGPIKAGDYLTISSLKGVAMKSDGKHKVVLGKALQGFADTSNAEGRVEVGEGVSKATVAIGRINVDIGVARNPGYSGDSIAGVPSFLTNIAKAVSNKPVTALRLYACLAVLFFSILIGGGILFAGARSGMLAVGRNPLAKKSIFRNMVTVVLMAMIVVIIGVVAVYLILKL